MGGKVARDWRKMGKCKSLVIKGLRVGVFRLASFFRLLTYGMHQPRVVEIK